MSAKARDAVAAICLEGDDIPFSYYRKADEILAALQPIIAAEIREYAKQADEAWQGIESYSTHTVRAELDDLATSADLIASRICGVPE